MNGQTYYSNDHQQFLTMGPMGTQAAWHFDPNEGVQELNKPYYHGEEYLEDVEYIM